MSLYSVNRSNVALVTTDDTMTFITPANRRIRIVEVSIGGMGTASAANEVRVARSTGGTTGGGALTSEPLEPDSVAAATVVNTTWAAQPTIGNVMLRLPVNANGGIYRWVARPGEEIIARNAGQISVRSAVGTSSVSLHVIYEEF
jgi:hypothetical protein